jgi:hypothetical protein
MARSAAEEGQATPERKFATATAVWKWPFWRAVSLPLLWKRGDEETVDFFRAWKIMVMEGL